MSFKILKVEQHEGGVFTKNNNLLNINVQSLDGAVLPSSAYIELEGVKFKNGVGEDVLDNVALGWCDENGNDNDVVEYDSSAFIKNIKITSDKTPLIEEVRFVNRRTQSQRTLMKSVSTMRNEYFLGRGGRCLMKDGKCNLQIPLSEVCGFGSIDNFSMNDLTGAMNFQIELEDQNKVAVEYQLVVPVMDLTGPDVTNNGADPLSVKSLGLDNLFDSVEEARLMFPYGSKLTLTYTDNNGDEQELENLTVSDVTVIANTGETTVYFEEELFELAAGVTYTNIQLSNDVIAVECADVADGDPRNQLTAENEQADDFTIGRSYLVEMETADNHLRLLSAKITDAVQAGNNVTLTFDSDFLPDGALTGIRIRVFNVETLDYEIEKVNLVIRHNPYATNANKSVVFGTYHLEMTNMTSTSDYRQQFDIEPGVMRMEWFTPTNSLVSVNDTLKSYRVSINEVDTTNRDVELDVNNNSLYYDKLMTGYASQLVNVNMLNVYENTLSIVESLPNPSASRLMVNLRMYSDDPMASKVVYLYKYIEVELS